MNTIETENSLGITFCDRLEISFTRGDGSYVWDEQDNKYLDFTSGWGVTCLGHSHPALVQAITAQAGKLIQNPNAGFTYSPYRAALLSVLKPVLPENLSKLYFVNSGAEANDAALKLARKITGRSKVISTQKAFHGRTYNTLSVSRGDDNTDRYVPKQQGNVFVPFNDIAAMAAQLDANTAAVIIEPVQGEGGVQIPDADYLVQVQTLCRAHGVLLIVDEIQTGFCRTGKFFALEHSPQGIQPDFLTLGKGIAGGFPFACLAVSTTVAEKIDIDDHGGTYCGNPLGCAISLAVINYLLEHNVAARVEKSGGVLFDNLCALARSCPDTVKEVRGKGLLCAIEFFDHSLARPLTLACAKKGLLVVPTRNGIIRLLPDLLVNLSDIDKSIAILNQVIGELGG